MSKLFLIKLFYLSNFQTALFSDLETLTLFYYFMYLFVTDQRHQSDSYTSKYWST